MEKASHKLDALQKMARDCAGDPNTLYLIGLLAEHAEEAEMTAEFLEWAGGILNTRHEAQKAA